MRSGLLLAAAALAGSLAFAPAPFPRPGHGPARLDLDRLQGTWKVVSLEETGPGGKRQPLRWGVTPAGVTHIRIQKDLWIYLEKQPGGRMHENTRYRIAVDPAKKPCAIDFKNLTGPAAIALGIVRRQGNQVQVLWFATTRRAENFEAPPGRHWLITLQRDK